MDISKCHKRNTMLFTLSNVNAFLKYQVDRLANRFVFPIKIVFTRNYKCFENGMCLLKMCGHVLKFKYVVRSDNGINSVKFEGVAVVVAILVFPLLKYSQQFELIGWWVYFRAKNSRKKALIQNNLHVTVTMRNMPDVRSIFLLFLILWF